MDEKRRKALIDVLRDSAQAASNAVASNVSGPVDLIAAALRAGGVPVPEDAVGGSKWMEKKGFTREVPMGAARIAGETLGLAGPSAIAVKSPQIAAAMNRAAQNAAMPSTLHPQAGAIVWHGSPHKFDKFDSSKIGTGEGAQAYGHGLYLAESPGVATSYKNLVQRDPTRLTVDGAVVRPDTMYGRAAEDVARIGVKATLQKIDDNIKFNEKYAPDMAELYKSLRTKIEALDPARVSLKEGNLYKVDLPDEKIARMLDWDKPLSQQNPAVAQAVAPAYRKSLMELSGGQDVPINVAIDMAGGISGSRAVELLGKGDRAAQTLRKAGIPGIRYLDGGSRGAGAGTSNFVVFPGEENALRILERNNQPIIDELRRQRR